MYPEEPYELDMEDCYERNSKICWSESVSTKYDFASAVKLESLFYYEVTL